MSADDEAILRERLDGLDKLLAERDRRYMEQDKLLAERDRRYTEQFQASKDAVASALIAAKELTGQAFASSEKAIAESKVAQADVNAKSNEFRGQLKDQNETMIPRPEANAKFASVEEKIDEIRKALAAIREQASSYPTRNEVGTMISTLSKDLADLREFRSGLAGRGLAQDRGHSNAQWVIAVAISVILSALSLVVAFIKK